MEIAYLDYLCPHHDEIADIPRERANFELLKNETDAYKSKKGRARGFYGVESQFEIIQDQLNVHTPEWGKSPAKSEEPR